MKKSDKLLLKAFGWGSPSELVFWSFRYFLGRMTIHACCFARDLARAWPHLDERIKKLIQSELDDEFERDDKARAAAEKYLPLGHDIDRESWETVRAAYTRQAESGPPGEGEGGNASGEGRKPAPERTA